MSTDASGTPLAKRLNLRDGQRVWFDGVPESVQDEIGEYALELFGVSHPDEGLDAAHLFVASSDALHKRLSGVSQHLDPKGHIWVSWPDDCGMSETDVREVGGNIGLVDTKAIIVQGKWPSLKFVIRKDER